MFIVTRYVQGVSTHFFQPVPSALLMHIRLLCVLSPWGRSCFVFFRKKSTSSSPLLRQGNFRPFFTAYNKLLEEGDYVTKRQVRLAAGKDSPW